MTAIIFDIEADGLLDTISKIHCIGIKDLETGEAVGYVGHASILEALGRIAEADYVIGHNIIGYDLLAIDKLYPDWKSYTRGTSLDTLVLTRLLFPHIKDQDFRNRDLPNKLTGSHSLKAWGIRLGEEKADYEGGFEKYSQEMFDYMMQDLESTAALFEHCKATAIEWGLDVFETNPAPGKDAIVLEHEVAEMCMEVEQHGFAFDKVKAGALAAKLTVRQDELIKELQDVFKPLEIRVPFTPKVHNKSRGYVKGVPTEKVSFQEFNPSSRQQVATRLRALGWVPSSFTNDGHAIVSEEILDKLPYPEAAKLAEYYTLLKRIGQVSNGKEAWLRHEKNGRIHGRIMSNGTFTGRMAHKAPNVAQVPAVRAPFGKECRECWIPDKGHILLDCDAAGLELRTLAGYMARYDNGSYINTVLEGDKDDGTDSHTLNAKAIRSDRDTAKTFFYAMVYGAGNAKLGDTIGTGPKGGARAKAKLMGAFPAMDKLIETAKAKTRSAGYVRGLDGRRLFSRSEPAALNTLLQGAGAVIMKRAMVIFKESTAHLVGKFHMVAVVHDEFVITCKPEIAEELGEICNESIRKAGEFYHFRCPMDGAYQSGADWSQVH